MRRFRRSFALLLGVLAVVLMAGACHKKKVAPPPPAEAPPPPPPKPTAQLTADPSTVEKGQSVTLAWSSENATDLDLQPGVGSVQAKGSTTVTPSDSTTYTLTVKGPGGQDTATARVTVTIPPPPPPPPPPSPVVVNEEEEFSKAVKDAYFDFDKADIRADAQQALTADADFLKQHTGVAKLTVEGQCDERGSEEYNLGLGDKRANAAKNFLANLGVSGDRIDTISYGKSRPVCTEHNEECWQQNRRAHFKYGGK